MATETTERRGYFTGWTPADAVVSVVIALLILVSAWNLVKDSVDVLLEGTETVQATINNLRIENFSQAGGFEKK